MARDVSFIKGNRKALAAFYLDFMSTQRASEGMREHKSDK